MFKCYECGAVFDEPCVITETNSTDRGDEIYMMSLCPKCYESFGKANRCRCGEYKFEDERICKNCREELLEKFIYFADGLTEEEEEQLDEWLDGNSIKDRKRFV